MYQNAGLSVLEVDLMSDEQIVMHYKQYIFSKRTSTVKMDRHPEDVQNRVDNMTSDFWGYDNFKCLQ
jgi:hypothetical protein